MTQIDGSSGGPYEEQNEALRLEIEDILRAQIDGGEDDGTPRTFESFQVAINPRYGDLALPVDPFAVVPFQVRGFKQSGRIAGIAPTGRNVVYEGVALKIEGTWEFFADSLCFLTDLGIAIAYKPPDVVVFGGQGGVTPELPASDVPSTASLAKDQNTDS